MDTKNPKSFMEAKLTSRAKETSNMKSAQVFNIAYTPNEILIRTELERVTDDLADYVNLGLPRHIIIYGSKGSGKTLSALIMAKALKDTKAVPYFYINVRENPTSTKIYRNITLNALIVHVLVPVDLLSKQNKIGFRMSCYVIKNVIILQEINLV